MTINAGQPELSLLQARLATFEASLKEETAAHKRTRELLNDAVAREESTDLLRFVLEKMPVLMNAFDKDGVCVAWNRECETVLGFSGDEMIGNPRALELFVPDRSYRERMLGLWESKGDHRDWEWEHTAKDGRKIIVAWSNLSISFPVEGWATWGIGVDVTERNQAEKQARTVR